MKKYLFGADIYLPDFDKVDGEKWAAVACDQFTSEPEYWEHANEFAKNSPSTLNLFLPEAYLAQSSERTPHINNTMKAYLESGVLECHKDSMIYLERTQSDGKIRRGIIGAIDLEEYDYSVGSNSITRATEGTVLDRIPPRVDIRRGAMLELPHIMILIDDPSGSVVEYTAKVSDKMPLAYDFDLMSGGGHVSAKFIDTDTMQTINENLAKLASVKQMQEKYGVEKEPLLFAMGDGNHSLASAKALYEEIKTQIGEVAAKTHPARYALCEIVNLHDKALEFEPIYRVVFGVNPEQFISDLNQYINTLDGTAKEQEIEYQYGQTKGNITIKTPVSQLAVGTVQNFLSQYELIHKDCEVDYIHGEKSVEALSQKENTVGITFGGMQKDELFKTVLCDGALPRKTFSMGHAEDKRYYIECRKIK